MSDKLSDNLWVGADYQQVEKWAADARALEERVDELLDEVDWYHDRAEAAEAEVERLRQAVEDGNIDDAKTYRENDALRAKLEKVRAVLNGDLEINPLGVPTIAAWRILTLIDGEGDHEA